jgi:hypothetical protein
VIKKGRKVVEQDWIAPHERVLVFNTGTGLQQPV